MTTFFGYSYLSALFFCFSEKLDKIKAKLASAKSKPSKSETDDKHSSSEEEYEFGKELREEKERKM